MISIEHLSAGYRSAAGCRQALGDVSLQLAAGEICAVIGPSGCGKSTLLKVLAGIITDFDGTAAINGLAIDPVRQRIGFIPQNYGLLPWKTAIENITMATTVKTKMPPDAAALRQLIEQLGLQGLEQRYPAELSGGQQQRVALARAFLLEPDLLLMDEPFSALDAITREATQAVFLEVWRQRPVTTLLVTHQVDEAVFLGSKILLLAGRPGRAASLLDNPLFERADSRSSRAFFESCLELRRKLREEGGHE